MASTIGTRLFTLFRGRFIGKDDFGNRYYESRRRHPTTGRTRRWVVYQGMAEPSKVPAEWHGWLHHTLAVPLPEKLAKKYRWQKPHLPNLTGTIYRYLPPGHLLKGGRRARSAADYEPWRPQ
jgi:NADH:ubiquinone oxidoreductase subunit